MNPLRPVDFAAFDRTRYDAQYLYRGESCIVLASNVPPGQAAFPHHVHEHSDQLYYVVRGEMHVRLGTEEHTVGPDHVVYIPQGTPHHNWNEGDDDELHLEVIAPAPLPSQAVATPTTETGAGGRGHFVRRLDESAFGGRAGFALDRLLQGSDGSRHMTLYVGQVAPGAGGPGTHVHPFDQFYFVLSGSLNVEVGLDHHVAETGTLVVLPAGVPHRQWNEGAVPERHVALLSPSPEPGRPLDVGVKLETTGEVYG